MRVIQSRSFDRRVKKLTQREKERLDDEIRSIMKNPKIGTEKKGDLRGVLVHKFKIQTSQFLLAYRISGETLELIMIGPHEDYYRDLKAHLRSK